MDFPDFSVDSNAFHAALIEESAAEIIEIRVYDYGFEKIVVAEKAGRNPLDFAAYGNAFADLRVNRVVKLRAVRALKESVLVLEIRVSFGDVDFGESVAAIKYVESYVIERCGKSYGRKFVTRRDRKRFETLDALFENDFGKRSPLINTYLFIVSMLPGT